MVVHPGKAKASDRTKRLRRRMGLVVARRITLELRGRHRRRIKCEACADWDCPATAGSDLERLVSHQ